MVQAVPLSADTGVKEWVTRIELTVSAKGMEWYGGPRKTGMHPAKKISLKRRVEAASPGNAIQNFEDFILSNMLEKLRCPSGFS